MDKPQDRPTDRDEQELRDILGANIRKYRRRRNWSQLALAEKIDVSTNFLVDLEAGSTWVSARTLVKLAKVFELEAHELLKPEKEMELWDNLGEEDQANALINRFSLDLTSVLKDSVEKAVDHVRIEFSK